VQNAILMYPFGRFKASLLVHKPAHRLTFRKIFVTVNGDFDPQRQPASRASLVSPPNDIRQTQIFRGYPNYPNNTPVGAAIAPSLHDGMGVLGGHAGPNHTAVAASVPKVEEEERNSAFVDHLPESKRRKFVLLDDPEEHKRVRVHVMLENVNIIEAPDDFRHRNCVYPRSFAPVGMQMEPRSARGSRFYADEDPEGGSIDDGQVTIGRTLVPVSMMEGADGEVPVPRIATAKKEKEKLLNDLGYRMAWGQTPRTKTFDKRTLFLQRGRTLRLHCRWRAALTDSQWTPTETRWQTLLRKAATTF